MKIKSEKIKIIIISILAVCSIFVIAGLYFYQVAAVPGHKSSINNSTKLVKTDPLYKEKKWYQNIHKQKWVMKSADDNLKLDVNYIPVANSKKTVIISHGFMNNKDTMGSYAAMFHKLGYNILLPDARGHGRSEGNYIGYGWHEKIDIKEWAKEVIQRNDSNSKIVIFGVSMGGATTTMASELAMPKQVKAYIEDYGYTNVKDEVEHEAVNLYRLPAFPRFPLAEVLSGIIRLRAGHFLGDGNSIKQVARNRRPIFSIHEEKDAFVPTQMVYKNYQAVKGKKELWVVSGAKHAEPFATGPTQYQKKVKDFLNRYL